MSESKSVKQTKASKRKMTRIEKKEARTGYLFIMPYVLMFILFTGIPFGIVVVMSFLNVKYLNKLDNVSFIGIDNFIKFFQDPNAMNALKNTAIYSLIYVPLIMVVGFIFAYLLNKGVYAKKFIRTSVFLPYITNMMAVGIIFTSLLGSKGPLGALYRSLEMTPLLQNSTWALPTIVAISVWKGLGLNMLTYLGALQNVNTELIEAAEIDGANKWQQIKNVIIPSVSPTTFFLLISSITTSLQNYTIIQSLTNGSPFKEVNTMSTSIIETAIAKNQLSYGSAQALFVFAIVMLITLIQWYGQKKWVNY